MPRPQVASRGIGGGGLDGTGLAVLHADVPWSLDQAGFPSCREYLPLILLIGAHHAASGGQVPAQPGAGLLHPLRAGLFEASGIG